MTNLEVAKGIIKENINKAKQGIYNCRNIVGDTMTTLHSGNGLLIDICYKWEYFEVFGLTDAEFKELEKYYKSLIRH